MHTLTFYLGLEHGPNCYVHYIKFTLEIMHTTTLHKMHTLKFNSSSLEIQLVPPIYRITFTSTLKAIRYHTPIIVVKLKQFQLGS